VRTPVLLFARALTGAAVLVAGALVAPGSGAGATPASLAPATSAFHPLAPTRLLDTRTTSRLGPGDTVDVAVGGRSGIPSGAAAVVINVTATATGAPGFVTAYPAGTQRQDTSVLNIEAAGQTLANLATVALGPSGGVAIYTSTASDIVVDAFGYYAPATDATDGRFVPLGPQRVLDTRNGAGSVRAGAPMRVDVTAAVPAAASAVVATLTVTDTAGAGFWAAWPDGAPRPLTSNVNATATGQTLANQIVIPLAGGAFDIYSQSGGQAVVDVTGYFTGPTAPRDSAGLFVPTAPQRVLDTRSADRNPLGSGMRPDAGSTVVVPTGDSEAVDANVTVVDATRPGFVTAYPAGTARPATSSLNADRTGQTIATHVTVPLGQDGLALYTQSGGHLLVDVSGYYTGTPEASTQPAETDSAVPPPDRIVIPAIGVDLPVGYGVDVATLADGPGYWPGYGELGQPGNVVIGAHRTSNNGPFRRIDEIEPGADIWVFARGVPYHYVADDHFIVSVTEGLTVVRQTTARELTIFACHPPGSETQRYVVRGHEVD
jgi:LPXTG-site transpeptidase (sortase) family protein